MSKIHFLPVRYGDAFLIECDKKGNHGVIMVDGGPPGLRDFVPDKVKEVGKPDLMVLTHYDEDHIYGMLDYANACWREKSVPAREVWANCKAYQPPKDMPKSLNQAVDMAKVLYQIVDLGTSKWRNDIQEGVKEEFPYGSIEVYSPTEYVRNIILGKMEKLSRARSMPIAADKMDLEEKEEVPEPADLGIPLEELALDKPKEASLSDKGELANFSSIGFLLSCEDMSVLMLGDCYPHNIEAYLRNVEGYSEEKPLEVDYVKVAHHGSMHNTSNELLDIIKCNHYIISTSGERFHHPDRTCLAHILCHPTRDWNEKVHIYLNYDLETIEKNEGYFMKEGEQEKYNFEVHENVRELLPLRKVEEMSGQDGQDEQTEQAEEEVVEIDGGMVANDGGEAAQEGGEGPSDIIVEDDGIYVGPTGE